jgi:hypothetical protein
VVFVRELIKDVLVIIFGVLGIGAPFFSVFVATFLGKTDISVFNSTMLMLLSILIIVYQLIISFNNLFNQRKKMFIIGLIFLLLDLISFLFNLVIFVNI